MADLKLEKEQKVYVLLCTLTNIAESCFSAAFSCVGEIMQSLGNQVSPSNAT